MKIISAFLILAFLVPAVVLACHCCPPDLQESGFQIQKTPCQGCCSSGEIKSPCGTFNEKPVSRFSQSSAPQVMDLALSEISITAPPVYLISDFPDSSPPPNPQSLSLVLRI